MAHGDEPLPPEESEQIDEWVERALRERQLSDPQLIQELQQFYQEEAQAVDRRLEGVWRRLEQRAIQQSQQGFKPSAWSIFSRRREHHLMRNPFSQLQTPRHWSARLSALAAAVLLVVLVGGLVAGLILGRHGSNITQGTHPVATSTPPPTPTGTPPSTSSNLAFSDIEMKDAATGWATAYPNPIVEGAPTLILHTTDGGVHWKIVTPKSSAPGAESKNALFSPSGSGSFVRTEDFLTGTVAWVLTLPNHFFKTMDGGQTWQPETAPAGTILQFTFLDELHGWIIMQVARAVVVYQTTDGGATWTRMQKSGSAFPLQTLFWGVRFLNLTTGWAVFLNTSVRGSVLIYKTADGGATWQLQHLALPAGAMSPISVNPPQFFDDKAGVIEVGFDGGIRGQVHQYTNDRPASGGGTAGLYVTHDGGATWEGPIILNNLEFPDFIDALHGWALNSTDSSLLTTSDSGHHWTTVSASPDIAEIGLLNFVSSQIGWALQYHQSGPDVLVLLLKTEDGGHTWIQINISVSN